MNEPLARLTTALAGRYRIERELGAGGMATVYLAHDLKHDRKVAVKVLRPELAAVLGAERFLAEIKVTANLQHPNLLPLFDSGVLPDERTGEASGRPYYVMPYVEGETLRARLERERQLDVDETIRLVTLLASALDYAHARRVIHRDLKPENILLQAGQPVIADFGIALAVAQAGGARVTETGLSLGTPHYMSPEQAAGEHGLDARSDQYSLAAVTYEMLAGEPPHTGPTAQAIIARLMTETPRSLRATRAAIQPAVERAVARALAKPPADRFSSCGDYARALATNPARRVPARRLVLAGVTGLVLVVAILVAQLVRRSASGAAAAGDSTVGVMMFDNLTHDTAYAYLADGLPSEIATSLARVPRLEVRSPGAVRSAQRGTDFDPREIGRRLDVRNVVEGEFQRAGDRIRITIRLVAVPSGTQRWGDSWTRPVTDLLAVQEEIARAVATAIAGRLLPEERSILALRATSNPEAYDHFLRGNFLLASRSPAGVSRAITEYREAVRLDSTFGQAEARMALGYGLYAAWGWDFPGVPVDSQLVLGFLAADRALAIDSTLADAWMARGELLSVRHPRTLEGALPALRRATELDPHSSEAWQQYGAAAMFTGQFEAAISSYYRALELEPGRGVTWNEMASAYDVLRRDSAALAAEDSAIAGDPNFYPAYAGRSRLRLRTGDRAGARADAEAALRLSPSGEEYWGLAPLAALAAAGGDTVESRRLMAQAVAPFATRPFGAVPAWAMVYGLVASGQRELALDWIERATPRGALLWWAMQYPEVDALRADPRFQRVMAESRPPEAR